MSNLIKNFIRGIQEPRKVIDFIICRRWGRRLADKVYISIRYWCIFGEKIHWSNPKTLNEKLNWEKIYDRNPQYSLMADKYAVKQFVAERIGKEYVVENYAVANKWDDIDFSKMPDKFVIKCTHDSGGAIVCKDKTTFDYESAKCKVERNLAFNWFWFYREWPYRDIKPRVIVDHLLDDHTGKELRDYKWWCFNGRPTYMYCTIKGENVYENFYDMDFEPVMIDHGFPRHQPEFEKPSNFELMKELATKLSQGVPFVRVDFFDVEGKVYFGEFTFYDWGGMRPFKGDWDERLGKLMDIKLK